MPPAGALQGSLQGLLPPCPRSVRDEAAVIGWGDRNEIASQEPDPRPANPRGTVRPTQHPLITTNGPWLPSTSIATLFAISRPSPLVAGLPCLPVALFPSLLKWSPRPFCLWGQNGIVAGGPPWPKVCHIGCLHVQDPASPTIRVLRTAATVVTRMHPRIRAPASALAVSAKLIQRVYSYPKLSSLLAKWYWAAPRPRLRCPCSINQTHPFSLLPQASRFEHLLTDFFARRPFNGNRQCFSASTAPCL